MKAPLSADGRARTRSSAQKGVAGGGCAATDAACTNRMPRGRDGALAPASAERGGPAAATAATAVPSDNRGPATLRLGPNSAIEGPTCDCGTRSGVGHRSARFRAYRGDTMPQ